jgi:hypothetical protein
MASPQHDVVLRVHAFCLFQWKRANAKHRLLRLSAPENLIRVTPHRNSTKYSFPNADASRDDAALEFGFLDDSARLLGDIDRVASLNRYSVF